MKPIPGHPGYAVTADGVVWRIEPAATGIYAKYGLSFPVAVKQYRKASGYMAVNIGDGQVLVHRLVAMAFLGEQPNACSQVAHGDGDRANNHASNLRWASAKENADDRNAHGRTVRVLSDGDVEWIRAYPVRKMMFAEMAKRLRVDQKTIRKAYAGVNFKHVPNAQPIPIFAHGA